MIKERYCSYELSKLLKEKGFDVPCSKAYMNDSMVTKSSDQLIDFNSKGYVSKPTHQMAMDWLREHGLHITIIISYDYSEDADGNVVDRWTFYIFEIHSSFSGELIYTEEVNEYDSYKDAVEAALKYALENLI